MKLSKLKSKIAALGNASSQNVEQMLADIQTKRDLFERKLDRLVENLPNAVRKQERTQVRNDLRDAAKVAKELGQHAYDLFPRKRLLQIERALKTLTLNQQKDVASCIVNFRALQAKLRSGDLRSEDQRAFAVELRKIDSDLAKILRGPVGHWMAVANNWIVLTAANALHLAIQPIGLFAETIARPLKSSRHWYTGGKVSRFLGHTIEGFLSRDSLSKTGLETSWGVRLIVPGTAGFIGNAGPWVMLYTGQIRDYQAMSVPFRVNPGATVATDVATFTWNRPGFGAGTATPFASGYVDAARSKLLVGRDGILYVRVGEWEGRGSYFTVSAFIPLLPWMHITWNCSIFSPGWAPLVEWSSPAVSWVRGQADWLYRTATKPFRQNVLTKS